MKIKADKEGRAVLVQICDQARKVCDLNSVGSILAVLNMIEEIPDEVRSTEQDNAGG